MKVVRVLLCDDDNHEYSVAFDDGRFFYSTRSLMAELASPHEDYYEIHIIHLVDLPCDNVRVGPFVMALDNWFDVIACNAVPFEYHDKKEFCKRAAFDVMWDRSEVYA